MKRIAVIVFLLFLLSSCRIDPTPESQPPQTSSESSSVESQPPNPSSDGATIRSYSVYEGGYKGMFNDTPADHEFNVAMAENPIDKKMNAEMETVDISGTREQQIFFSDYAKWWDRELEHSLDNLKKYLPPDDQEILANSQKLWEQGREANRQLDANILAKNEIIMGTQVVSSGLNYWIDLYKERIFHIKYMTYLVENYVEDPVPLEEQTWNNFTPQK